MRKITLGFLIFVLIPIAYGSDFTISSSAFKNSSPIPILYSCDGDNISPPLSWHNPPSKTQSYVLIMYNPDAPFGTYYNWILFNIPKTITSLPERANKTLPKGIQVGVTSSGDNIYRGPCPPNAAIHHYIFKIFALDTTLNLGSSVSNDEILANMQNHILAEAEWVGTFNH